MSELLKTTETEGELKLPAIITKTFYESTTFTTGKFKHNNTTANFAGKIALHEGETITLVGNWRVDPKYGRQFAVRTVDYSIPETLLGQVNYIAGNPRFKGIGQVIAERLCKYIESAHGGDINQFVSEAASLPPDKIDFIRADVLKNFIEVWPEFTEENEALTFLAQFNITQVRARELFNTFGTNIIGILKDDPYQIMSYVDGMGFKRVDVIALSMGVPKNNPERIKHGIWYALNDSTNSGGHTWIMATDLMRAAEQILIMDTHDDVSLISSRATEMLVSGELFHYGASGIVANPAIYHAEASIAGFLDERVKLEGLLDRTELESYRGALNEKQFDAFCSVFESNVSIITGGAGTGKTHLLGQIVRGFQSASLSVTLAAPTGKAAKRMEDMLYGVHGLNVKASTLHRLMGYNGTDFKPEPIVGDVLIIDESSMVDVKLMAEVISRWFGRYLILVGDYKQLPPVGPGLLLRDTITHEYCPVHILTDVVRQGGALKKNSNIILDGVVSPTVPGEWELRNYFDTATGVQVGVRTLIDELVREGMDARGNDMQVLTPVHKGPLGTIELNKMLQELLNKNDKRVGRFIVGDKIIQTKNDYAIEVMNGTQGTILELNKEGAWIGFWGLDEPEFVLNEKLKNIELAYVITAHKAQGSEWPHVIVVAHKAHYFADRNWLYTAVTRASERVFIMGDRWGIKNIANKNSLPERRTFLDIFSRAPESAEACNAI